jgi:hypothetical protein
MLEHWLGIAGSIATVMLAQSFGFAALPSSVYALVVFGQLLLPSTQEIVVDVQLADALKERQDGQRNTPPMCWCHAGDPSE